MGGKKGGEGARGEGGKEERNEERGGGRNTRQGE